MIKIISINNIYKNFILKNIFIYIILTNDFFLKKIIKNLLIKNINKFEKNVYIKNYYINNNVDLLNTLYKNLNLDIFNKKYIVVLYINEKFIFNENILTLLSYYNNNLIFIINYIIEYNFINSFLNSINNKINICCIKENNISFNKFMFIINNTIGKKYNIINIDIETYNWLYLIYKDNFIDINNIILYLYNNNFNFSSYHINKLSKISFLNVNYNSWIYLSLLGYKELSNFSLLIFKNNKNNNIFIDILKNLKKNMFFILFNILKKEKYIINNNLFINNMNIKYKKILFEKIYKINTKKIYKIFKIMHEIDFYIKNYNNEYENIIWNKLDLISLLLYN